MDKDQEYNIKLTTTKAKFLALMQYAEDVLGIDVDWGSVPK